MRSEEEKRRIVGETFKPGVSVSAVARRHGLNAKLLFTWQREMGRDASAVADDPMAFVPVKISAAPATASAPSSPSVADQMEIRFARGVRLILERTVDGVALARAQVLSRGTR